MLKLHLNEQIALTTNSKKEAWCSKIKIKQKLNWPIFDSSPQLHAFTGSPLPR